MLPSWNRAYALFLLSLINLQCSLQVGFSCVALLLSHIFEMKRMNVGFVMDHVAQIFNIIKRFKLNAALNMM